MRQCNYCGKWIEDDDLMFCPECGERLEEPFTDEVQQQKPVQDKHEKLNRKQIIKIAFVVFGFLAVVSACICVLCLG